MTQNPLEYVKISDIDDDVFPMRELQDDLKFQELCKSIKRDGIISPILLIKKGEKYAIIAGHRRFAAAKLAELAMVPAQISNGDKSFCRSAAFAENMFRKDLSPMEEAAAVNDALVSDEFTVDSLAVALGRSKDWISFKVQMMTWPDEIQLAVHQNTISTAAARNLAQITDEAQRLMLVSYAVDSGATARTTSAWYQSWKVGTLSQEPAGLETAEPVSSLPPVVPFTPCVLCATQLEMAALRYVPVCPQCTPVLLEVANSIRASNDGG